MFIYYGLIGERIIIYGVEFESIYVGGYLRCVERGDESFFGGRVEIVLLVWVYLCVVLLCILLLKDC